MAVPPLSEEVASCSFRLLINTVLRRLKLEVADYSSQQGMQPRQKPLIVQMFVHFERGLTQLTKKFSGLP
jgi:hypothetical protein